MSKWWFRAWLFVALEMGVFQTLGCLEGYVCVRNAVFGFLIMVETGC